MMENNERWINGPSIGGACLTYEEEGELLTSFGGARLVQFPNGALELQGGSRADRQAAYEWLSLFWHEAVVREVVM